MDTVVSLPPPVALPRDHISKRKMVPYSVELLDSLDDTIESFINGGAPYNAGDAIEEEDEDDEAVVSSGEKNRRASGSSVKSNGSGALATADPNGRLVRRAKRPHRDRAYSVSEGGKFGSGAGVVPATGQARVLKNSRKSRNGFGRGLPKKGGAGGKGTWGKFGCELDLPWVDPNDPNYESDGEQELAKTDLQKLVPEMSEEDVRKAFEPLILEYFENNDTM